MLAVMASVVVLALAARQSATKPEEEVPSLEEIAPVELVVRAPESARGAWRPDGVPDIGSPLLDGQERIEGLDQFVGETLKFDFGWQAPGAVARLVAARSAMRVGVRSLDGRKLYVLQGSGRTFGLVKSLWDAGGDAVSLVDAPTGLPLTYSVEYREDGKREKETLVFDETGRRAQHRRIRYDKPVGKGRERQEALEAFARLDPVSVAFYLRANLGDSERMEAKFLEGQDTYAIRLKRIGREEIEVRAGKYAAVKLRMDLVYVDPDGVEWPDDADRATIWVSDDHRKIPLRLESDTFVGKVVAELTERKTR